MSDDISSRDDFTPECARVLLELVRWGDPIRPICPKCGKGRPLEIYTRQIYRCRSCQKQFTVTSGTVFDRHKLTHPQLLKAMLWWEETKGNGRTCDLMRLLGCTWKTAHVMKMRLMEGHLGGGGSFAFFETGPFFARWYWQGFNTWHIEDGVPFRYHKDGRKRAA